MASPLGTLLVSFEKSWRVLSDIDYLADVWTSFVQDDIIDEFNGSVTVEEEGAAATGYMLSSLNICPLTALFPYLCMCKKQGQQLLVLGSITTTVLVKASISTYGSTPTLRSKGMFLTIFALCYSTSTL